MEESGVEQLAFDFDELARQEARDRVDEWDGAPLHFTMDYYPPVKLDEAFEHWCFINGRFDSIARSHMWHRALWHRESTVFDDHRGEIYTADLTAGRGKVGPGSLVVQMICEPCQWHTIAGKENRAVEAWHYHAVPGWRELPVVPSAVRVRSETGLTKLAKAWIAEHYPAHMQVPGAPIITERAPHGTRHVPSYSPWGGYDLSSTALDSPTYAESATRRSPGANRGFRSVSAPGSSKRPELDLGW